jgi:glyoxylase-like metal-dependent hydrolase (beta-lactamase superfamily II)
MKKLSTRSGAVITKISGGRSNVFLIETNKSAILVDTSSEFFRKRLMRKFKKRNIHALDYLILTHTHFDHAGNVAIISSLLGGKLMVHHTEAEYLKSGHSPAPAGTNKITRWLIRNSPAFVDKLLSYEGCEADIILTDDLQMTIANTVIEIIHTPGHSPGSISVLVDREIALVGDTLFGTYPGSCFPPFADDLSQLMMSWQKLLDSGCELFYPAHGGIIHRNLLERSNKQRAG